MTLDRATGEVLEAEDLIQQVSYYDYGTGRYSTPSAGQSAAFGRFCSATLAESGRFYNPRTGRGTYEPIYFGNEEVGVEGRTFCITPDGRATQLPRLGLTSWENTVPAPNRSDTSLVMGNDDSNPGEILAYVGTKTSSGPAVQRAGLTNGRLSIHGLSRARLA
jgi:hypothetical protein